MNVNAFLQKDYENESPSGPKKQTQNKPNSNPIKACPERIEFTLSVIEGNGPILERMNVNFCAAVHYESKPTLAANNPNLDFTTAFSCGMRIVA